jgi:protein SCO1/2
VRQLRVALWALIAVIVVAIGAFVLPKPPVQTAQQPVTAASPTFGGPFTLIGSDGKPFGTDQLKGKPYALFFGFTHCPDTCPTTLARLVKLRREAGGDSAFNIVFVTVDPERDGPKEMGAYAQAFGAPIIGLTGSPAQIDQVKKEFGIYSQKVPTGDGDYTVDHTATVLLFDRDGKFVATLSPDEQDQPALDKLKRITAA